MRGDFSRDTFDPSLHFSRVLMQQGRVLLDADWNEQAAITQHALRTLAKDLFDPHGGIGLGFRIGAHDSTSNQADFAIGAGYYYVDGIRCECEPKPGKTVTYQDQPDYRDPVQLTDGKKYLVYLDVWERHLSYVEQETEGGISIREIALGSADTTTRAQVVWQVRAKGVPDGKTVNYGEGPVDPLTEIPWKRVIEPGPIPWPVANPRVGDKLSARAKARGAASVEDPCIIPPESRYRGSENQLYRVEVHRGGKAWDGADGTLKNAATFKWSRENGSIVFPLRSLEGKTAVVEHLGADGRLGLHVGDWVELVDDWTELGNSAEDDPRAPTKPGPLLQVTAIDPIDLKVTLSLPADADRPMPVYNNEEDAKEKHALLRRWDQQAGRPASNMKASAGALAIVEKPSADKDNWLALEDGIQVQFEPGGYYRTGDYWLIPARTATGDVEWPGTVENPTAMPPHGIDHHYAPLAVVHVNGNAVEVTERCRRLLVLTFKADPPDPAH